MKKIVSIVLAISLCLSAVLLLASCKGKSAYEVAVENGFQGDEKAWLESLKGQTGDKGADGKTGKPGEDGMDGFEGITGYNAYEVAQTNGYKDSFEKWFASLKGKDGKDGHIAIVTVDTNGYWVIDGAKQPVKVNGEKAAVVSIELAETVFSVVKGNATAPKLSLNVTLNDGTVSTIPVSNSIIADSSYDFTKEGSYDVTITYGGQTKSATITVEGLMVMYEDFNTFTNDATMAEILSELGWKLPVGIYGHADSKYISENMAENFVNIPGVDLTPYAMVGWLRRPNYVYLAAENGRLFVDNHTYNPTSAYDEAKSGIYFDGVLFLRDEAYMSLCFEGDYTIQFDIEFSDISAKGHMYFAPHYGNDGANGQISRVGLNITPTGKFQSRISKNGSWKNAPEGTLSVVGTLFAGYDPMPENFQGQKLTVKMVMVNDITSPEYGISYYIKPEAAENFTLIYTMADDETTAMIDRYTEVKGMYNNLAICMGTNPAFYLDNVAIWTGTGAMPTNTSTGVYETAIIPAA